MTLALEELAANAHDNEEGRLKIAQLYNQVCNFPLASFSILKCTWFSLFRRDLFPFCLQR
jgi:hypothetical protein